MSVKIDICRVRQPGFYAKLIQVFTGSRWNHLMLRINHIESFYMELDFKGRFSFYDLPKDWEIEVVETVDVTISEYEWIIHKSPRYNYSHKDNVIAFFGQFSNKLRKYFQIRRPESWNTNCVGYCEQLLKRTISYSTPGNFGKNLQIQNEPALMIVVNTENEK